MANLIHSFTAHFCAFFKNKNRLTSLTALIIFISVISAIYQQKKWQTVQGYVINDVRGYYSYLPYLFIYDDIEFKSAIKEEVWFSINEEDSTRYMKYTTGMAIAYAPGFFIAHAISKSANSNANGYSLAYQISFIITALIFLIIALSFTRKLLLIHFSDRISSIVLLIIFLGTNLFHYSSSCLAYAHLYSYTLIVCFLYFCVKWLKNPTIKTSFLIGFLAGWFVLIRPIDLLFVVFPLVYQISNLKALRNRWKFIKNNKRFFIPILLGGLIVWIPQLTYLYSTFGTLKLNTYSQEQFYFASPHFYDTLFSFRDGWLIYSPLMLLAVLGVLFFSLRQKYYFYTAVILAYWFIIASWWCWWYQGFGNRAFINLYPFLLLPLGYGLEKLFQMNWIKNFSKLVVVCGIFLSLFHTAQFETGAYTTGKQTFAAYKENFLELQSSVLYFNLLAEPDMNLAMAGSNEIYVSTFDTIFKQKCFKEVTFSTPGYFPLHHFKKKQANTISVRIETNHTVNEQDFLFLKSSNNQIKINEFTRVNQPLFSGSILHYFATIEGGNPEDTLELILSKEDRSSYRLTPFSIDGLVKNTVLKKID
ncbi:MAG: hypothetical protein ACPGU5_03985 [Lishizhenia sp.]